MQVAATALARATESQIVELRQYSLRPGGRDILIDTFDRWFIEPQEAAGAQLIGQFRDLDDPHRFVWLRGFPDMRTRRRMLETFYSSPLWLAHRETVNELLVDSDNVLLLRVLRPGSGFIALGPPPAGGEASPGVITATICLFEREPGQDVLDVFESELRSALTEAGAPPIAAFVTETSPNDVPRLPVREGEHAIVWFTRFPDRTADDTYVEGLARRLAWSRPLARLECGLVAAPQTLRLAPTPRSALR
jgi:hypothetical protein